MLMGPTASGKTGLSLQLAARLDCEIISVDSAQVYRGMDIGTAKVDVGTRARIPHHLIDVADPAEPYSAARFRDDALRLIEAIRARGRTPLLVGGTMLYYRALLQGLGDLPRADPALRQQLGLEAAAVGWPVLHARLARLDPATAERLHPNDSQRIQRALEVVMLSGRSLTELQRQSSSAPSGPWLKIALSLPDRALLHARIEQRVHEMMQAGFLAEVQGLHARGDLHAELPSIRAVGYRQLWGHLEGEYGLPEAMQRTIAATRQFAKRQLTWLRSEPDLHLLDARSPDLLTQSLALLRCGLHDGPC